jgi:dephospho-CoA kinase
MHIAITGTIGSGKSTVAELLRSLGYPVFDADAWAKSHYADEPVKAALIERFGEALYPKGQFDGARLASIIFDPKAEADLRFVEGLIHPLVYADLTRLAKDSAAPIVFSEVPLLYETDGAKHFDRVLLVTSDPAVAHHRLITHRHLRPEIVALRRARQLDDDQKRHLADDILENNGDLDTLMRHVVAYSDKIKAIHEQNP